MRHLKGNAREYCTLGHKLELPIGLDFIKDVNGRKNLGENVRILSLHKAGLVGMKNCPWAKDSIDFVVCVLDENDESLELWGVEIKSRQNNNTINKEKETMRKLRRAKYEEIEDEKVHTYIYKKDERLQLLHHAYVYNFDKVVHVVGDNAGKVMNATVVSYNSGTLEYHT